MVGLIISPLFFQNFSIPLLPISLHARTPDKIMVTKILLDDARDAVNEKDTSKALIRLDWASQQVPANKTLSLNESKSNSLQLAKIFIDDASDAVKSGNFGKASQRIALAKEQLPVGSLTANQTQVSKKPIVTNQKVTLKEGSNITLQGIVS